MRFPISILLLGWVPWLVGGLAPTDEIQDADTSQSGYLPNHNMQPAVVGSASFGILWKNNYLPNEKWYAKPLVYTPNGKKQLVFTASHMNWIRTVDAVTGTLINSRQVQPPFLQSDIGCTDIPNYIGIIGTPTLDPATEIVYFFSKGYKKGASSGGVLNGQYKFYAVDVNTLADVPGFPVIIDGHNADNDPIRYFLGGTVLQRPALAVVGSTVFGGFGGHCDLFNYTGMVVGVSKTPGVGITSIFAMESSPGAPTPQPLDYLKEQGGKAGIWQGGMGIATDGNRIFFATGNGQGHVNQGVPASGRTGLSTLDECVVNLGVDASGKLSLSDYFEPYEYTGMDAGDRDLGSGGVALLDPNTFHGTNGISRLAVTIGKNGKLYIMNADNLGGFKQGPGGTDAIVQRIIAQGPVFGGSGSYPLEGGFIYFTPIGYPTVAYELGLDSNGSPLFTLVGQAKDVSAGRVGVGVPTITSYKGQAGTGILWITDVDAGLEAYNAVPDQNGILTKIQLPPTNGLNKFQRPAFGDGRLYVTDGQSNIICLGSPVSLPLNCTQPVEFGEVAIGNTSTQTVTCTSLIAITKLAGIATADGTFQVSNASLPTGPLAQGAVFSFPVVWNLTQTSINDAQNASFGTIKPGVKTTSLTITTIHAVAKFSTMLPITLQGTTVSKSAFLNLAPSEVDFGGIVVGGPGSSTGLSAAMTLSNVGSQTLTFTGFAWTLDPNPASPGKAPEYANTSDATSNGAPVINVGASGAFTSSKFPVLGSSLAPGDSVTVPLNFFSNTTGVFSSFLTFWSNGGTRNVFFSASATLAPIANISISKENGWDESPSLQMDFGNMQAGTIAVKSIRICNSGGSALQITKSKPPVQGQLFAQHPGIDLHEGQSIPINSCALGPIEIDAAAEGPNRAPQILTDSWILNTDDVTFNGPKTISVSVTIMAPQVGPFYPNGTARFQYLGCYYDGAGRQLQTQIYSNSSNENGLCTSACYKAGYILAGTQYHTQCWCGNPSIQGPMASKFYPDAAKKCVWSCPGDTTGQQGCGGPGTFMGIYYDTSRYTPGPDSIPSGSASSTTSSMPSTPTSTVMAQTSAIDSNNSTTTPVLPNTSTDTATTPPATPVTSTVTPIVTSTVTPTAATTTNVIQGFYPAGCYADLVTGHSMKLLVANDSMTPDVCISAAKAALSLATPTTYRYVGLEYGRECYAATAAPSPQPSTLVGSKACTVLCRGDNAQYCGAGKQYNLYFSLTDSSAHSVTTPFSTAAGVFTTGTVKAISTA